MTTQINSQSVNVILAKKLQVNYWAGQLYLPDYGVNEGFSTDTNAATIRVVRQIAPGIKGRRIGATTNGAAFNSANAIYPTSEEYNLDITDYYDGNIDIPEVSEDMFSLSVVEAEGDAMGGEFATFVNAMTIAEQVATVLNAYSVSNTSANIVTFPQNATTTQYRDGLLTALGHLDNGDSGIGVQTFPAKARQIIVRPSFKTGLFQANNILLGGSNLAQELLAKGRISENTYTSNGDLFIGEFMQVPVCVAPDTIWTAAWTALCINNAGTVNTANNITNVTAAATELAKINALVVSSVGTLRGIAMGNRIKQVDAQNGAGIRLQPKMRMGVKCISAKSVVPVVSYGFTAANIIAYTNATVYTKLVRLPEGSQG
jgi:hypothetical protein